MLNHLNKQPSPSDPDRFAATSATFALHPLTALALFALDHMLAVLEAISFGLFALASVLVGILAIGPVSAIQRRAYGDDRALAVAKGCIVGLLLAVPSPLPSYLTAMWGIASFIATKPRPPTGAAIDTDGFDREGK